MNNLRNLKFYDKKLRGKVRKKRLCHFTSFLFSLNIRSTYISICIMYSESKLITKKRKSDFSLFNFESNHNSWNLFLEAEWKIIKPNKLDVKWSMNMTVFSVWFKLFFGWCLSHAPAASFFLYRLTLFEHRRFVNSDCFLLSM